MFRLVEAPSLSPGTCFMCNSGHASPCVDTLMQNIDGNRIYVCERCVNTMASMFGWLTPEDAAKTRAALEGLTAALDSAEAELEQERANKLVSLEDAFRLVEARNSVSTPAPA
jgi:protein-arginine kinase activator protein McsA